MEITIEGLLDHIGFVIDFADLNWMENLIRERLDHRHLNDVLPTNPTSEHLSTWLAEQTAVWLASEDRGNIRAFGIRIAESPTTSASVWRDLRP